MIRQQLPPGLNSRPRLRYRYGMPAALKKRQALSKYTRVKPTKNTALPGKAPLLKSGPPPALLLRKRNRPLQDTQERTAYRRSFFMNTSAMFIKEQINEFLRDKLFAANCIGGRLECHATSGTLLTLRGQKADR